MARKSTKNPKGTKVVREVELDLEEGLKLKLADELADKSRALTKLRQEFAEVSTKWKERIKPVSDRVDTILSFFEDGKEKKTVECVAVKNHQDNKVEYWFEGKIVDHRPMTTDDLQDQLKLTTKRGRTKENSVKFPTPTESEDIASVRKLETSKRTKHSSVDGPTANGAETKI